MYEFIGEGIEQGPYAKFFRATSEIRSKDIICFDLAGLEGHDRLKAVLVPALLSTIMNTIFGSQQKTRKKLCIIDECWKVLNDENAELKNFMTSLFRIIRKLNGSIDIVTQSFADVLNTDVAKAIITNTSFYYAIGNVHDRNDLAKIQAGNSRLSEYDIEKIIYQQPKRDFYLLTPFFKGQLRLYPTKEFCMLATTHPPHKEILWKYQKQLGVTYTTPEVIEAARHEF
jgi:type IV secretory pathway VirB4 component